MTETVAETKSLSPWWRHATTLVMIGGFSVLATVTSLRSLGRRDAPRIVEAIAPQVA